MKLNSSNIIAAALVALGIFFLGVFIRSGINNMAFRDRQVTVKGLAEREVEANNVTWPIQYSVAGNDLLALYDQMTSYNNKIVSFLTSNGLTSDDISIGTGKLRIRPSGSAGGHNGLKSIIQHLGSDQFPRIKVGVGSPQHAEHDIVDWVIGKPMGEDAKVLTQALEKAAEAVSAVIAQGPQKAMNKYNG